MFSADIETGLISFCGMHKPNELSKSCQFEEVCHMTELYEQE